MTETKPIRLVAAAKKLNVGTHTLVEHLREKGYEVEDRPTTKLEPAQYDCLMKEFAGQIEFKEKAEQITLGGKNREDIEIEDKGYSKARKKDEGEDIFIKTASEDLTPSPTPQPKEESLKAKLDGPKVVGKIDLDADKKKKAEAVKVKAEAAAKAEAERSAETEAKKTTKETPAEKPETPSKSKVKTRQEPPKEDFISTKKVSLEGPKIRGKIDLSKIQPNKPAPKKDAAASGGSDDANERKRRRRRKVPASQLRPGETEKKDPKDNKSKEAPQISEKDIEEKLKATLAKIKGQSGKSSRAKHRRTKRDDQQATREKLEAETEGEKLLITEFISVSELASLMNVAPTEVISKCMSLGVIVSINQRIDAEIIELVAEEFGHEVEFIDIAESDEAEEVEIDDPKDLTERAPIVTVMGHVDHGKTTLLDFIKDTKIADKEAGGITQHIGAYEVVTDSGKRITFLDTPGHEAFTAMRARGAKLTDIAVIVIAADDQIMPQTKEAISHAQSAGVPMVFALNKMDKEGALPEKIKEQLAGMDLLVEDWGGKYQSQEISAKAGTNVTELLEKILLESELLELKANADKQASGAIIEASLDKGRGYVATMLVQSGTLRVGDMLVTGPYFGKVKAMFNHLGKKIKEAGPAVPVQILGLNGAPQAGEKFKIYESEQEAKNVANRRSQLEREQGIRTKKHITLDEIGRRLALGNFKELNIIIKGDVDGSIEALTDSLLKLSTEEVQVNILHKGVGAITESDILLASASDAIIIGFQVRPSSNARKLADNENIEIRLYSIIYQAIDEIKSAMEGMLEPKIEEKIVAELEIREVFKITGVGTIAGCFMTEGKIKREHKVRVIRDGIVVYTGLLGSLKRYKDDVKEVVSGQDCGLNIKDFNDVKVGDIVEGYEEIEVQRTL